MRLAIKLFRTTAMAPTKVPKSTKATKKESAANSAKKEEKKPQAIIVDKVGDFAIKVLAKPGSKENGITGITEEGLEVKIAAPPVDGEANTELISYLSKLFGLRKSDLSLDRGSRSRVKTVTVSKGSGMTLERINEVILENVGK
jgi:uncharacterized protein